jgi:adenylosuccinate synthase
VGAGPFPSELLDEMGMKLNRDRIWSHHRPVLKYCIGVNCYTAINLTKLDILDTFPEIKVSVAYRHSVTKGKIEGLPADLDLLGKVEYVVFKGWLKSIGQCRSFYDLPLAVSNSGVSLFPSY